jgi:hypothetical protein
MKRVLIPVSVLFLVLGCAGRAALAPTETRLGDYVEGGSGGFSHRWLAYIQEPEEGAADQGRYVVLNGQRLGPYTNLSRRFEFSTDGEHIAFAAEKDGKWHVAVDGQDKWQHDGLGWPWYAWTADLDGKTYVPQTQAAGLTFSPDGEHLAYSVTVGEQWAAALDGKPGPTFETTGSDKQFVEGKLVYWAKTSGGEVVVFGDQILGPYDSTLRVNYSADGKHFVFAAEKGGEYALVQDGQESDPGGEVVSYAMGPTGELAYAARSGSLVKVHFGGREMPGEYDEIQYLTISPDGKHVAYWARQGSSWSVVTDSATFPGFDGYYAIRSGGEVYCLLWDKSSQNLAYLARSGDEGILVLNGQQQTMPAFGGIAITVYTDDYGNRVGVGLMGGAIPDRQAFVECLLQRAETQCDPMTATLAQGELAYVETGTDQATMVIGKTRAGPYASIQSTLMTSADGKHYAYVIGTDEGERVTLDGKQMQWTYDKIYRPQFVGDRGFGHLGKRDNTLFSVFYPYP